MTVSDSKNHSPTGKPPGTSKRFRNVGRSNDFVTFVSNEELVILQSVTGIRTPNNRRAKITCAWIRNTERKKIVVMQQQNSRRELAERKKENIPHTDLV